MSRTFPTSIALSALLAVLAAPAMAQDTAPAPQPPAAAGVQAETQAETQAEAPLPKALQDAGLTDVTRKRGPHGGTRIEAKLPDGSRIGVMLDDKGQLRGLRAKGEAALPRALVEQLVPQAVRDSAVYAELGTLKAVFSGQRGVMLAGQDGDRNKVRAAFAEDGTLLRFGRGDDDRPGFRDRDARHDRKGDHHRRHHRDDDRGWHREGRGEGQGEGRGEDRGPGRDLPPPPRVAPEGQAPADAPQRQGAVAPAQPLGRGAVGAALTATGYSGLGEITQDGRRILAQAVNPEGEPVSLEMNAQGRVMREINR
ncbi:hypothetical protein [Paracoccus simplex]|uniref:Uncharacterized protein n=1 Tax=Paracoccus simplex TaxID=2086346 RepID=A0ABV7RY52_9RHOB